MKKKVAVLATIMMCSMVWGLLSDDLTPPGPPGSEAAKMKTLNELEPRNIISSLPYAISNAGSYYLGSSLWGSPGSNGIIVVTNDVQIDLSGFSMNGAPGSLHGILVENRADNITIRNGVIRKWGGHGINATNASSVFVSDVKVAASAWGGIYVGKNSAIERCTITGGGWNAPTNMTFMPLDDGIQCGEFSTIRDCKIQGNGGAGVHTLSHTRISGCTITENRNAEGVFAHSYCVVENSTCAQNGVHGIQVVSNCTITANTCGQNGQNTNAPSGTAGIQITGSNNVIKDNNCFGADLGISIVPEGVGNLVIRNMASGNKDMNYETPTGNYIGEIVVPSGGAITNKNPWANFGF